MTIAKEELRAMLKRKQEHVDLDYKRDLVIITDGDKAAFVKDVLSLANSGDMGYIVTGVQDQTWKLVGISKSHRPETLYQILENKVDPPVVVEYAEFALGSRRHGIVKVIGDNPPYIVGVPDSFGGPTTGGGKKTQFIHRGTIYVRNINRNTGIARAQLDRLYQRAEVLLNLRAHRLASNPRVVVVDTSAENVSRSPARSIQMLLKFTGALRVMTGAGAWQDATQVNDNVPTVCVDVSILHHGLPLAMGKVQVQFADIVRDIRVEYQIRGENVPSEDEEAILDIHDTP